MNKKIKKKKQSDWTIGLNVFYIDNGNFLLILKKIYPVYVSRYNSGPEKQIIPSWCQIK